MGEMAIGRVGLRNCVEARSRFSGRDRRAAGCETSFSTFIGGGGEALRFRERLLSSLWAEPGRDDGPGGVAIVGTADDTPEEEHMLFGEQELKDFMLK